MPRFRPLAIACAKLAVVLLFLNTETIRRGVPRGSGDGG